MGLPNPFIASRSNNLAVGGAISGGTDTRVLFNDNGVVGEDSGLTFNKTTDALTVAGPFLAGTSIHVTSSFTPTLGLIATSIATATKWSAALGGSTNFIATVDRAGSVGGIGLIGWTNGDQLALYLDAYIGSTAPTATAWQARVFKSNGAGNTAAIGSAEPAFLFTNNATTNLLALNGGGSLIMGSAAIATNATDGFFYANSGAGAPTGTPTTYTGRVPMYVDTTNAQLWMYLGGAWAQPKTPAGAALVTWQ